MKTSRLYLLIAIFFLLPNIAVMARSENPEFLTSKLTETTLKEVQNHPKSSTTLYNLGTLNLMNDKLGDAIYFLEKAKQLAPRDKAIRQNLRIAYSRVVAMPQHDASINVFLQKLSSYFHLTELLSIVFLGCGIIIVAPKLSSITTRLQILGIMLCIGFIPLTIAHLMMKLTPHIIIHKTTPLRHTPSSTIEPKLHLHEGVKAQLLKKTALWSQIKCSNGIQGWIKSSSSKKI